MKRTSKRWLEGGGGKSLLRRLLAHPLEFTLALVLAGTPLGGAFAAPLGPQVQGGQITFQGLGTKNTTINQSTQNGIINWYIFNVGAGETVTFNQLNANSNTLNRVTGGLGPSQVYGSITANGRIFLVNPDGILFGLGSSVNAAGFLATTHDISNADFMSNTTGRYNFNIPGRLDASIVNFGTITATNGGFAALVAPGVRNAGVINARLGHVALASGNGFTLDFYGDKLITLQVGDIIANQVIDVATQQPLSALVKNEGKLRANGGTVSLTAVAARHVVDSVINNSGVVEANSVGTKNGMIVLGAATASTKPADTPTQNVVVSGTLSARGHRAHQKGGTVVITGESVALQGAKIDASGGAGGGTVLVGGDTGGGHPNAAAANIPQSRLEHWQIATASSVTIDSATTINASATRNGDGGKVVVWSNGLTSVAGLIAASGGPFGGNGGFVETSGHSVNFDGLRVNTSAPAGTAGLWLVDPTNLVVDAAAAATIASNLATTDVTLITNSDGAHGPGNAVSGDGDIIINSAIAWSSGNTLTLDSMHAITVNAPITMQGAGTLSLLATNAPDAKNVPLISFGSGGSVQFTGTPNSGQALVINDRSYTLLYNMSDVQGLNASSETLSGHYALAKPIDASGVTGWVPIGNSENQFSGVFNGMGLSIDKLAIVSPNSNVGLFGVIGSSGVVSNLALTNASVTAGAVNQHLGVLAGSNYGIVTDVRASGAVSTGTLTQVVVGGLVGQNMSGGVVSGTAAVDVTVGTGLFDNWNAAGGLVGINNGTVSSSSASGTITGADAGYIGGLVGSNFGSIDASFATGNVSGGSVTPINGAYLGGLVGVNWSGSSISNSYASGNVAGLGGATMGSDLGGFIGPNWGSISNSYAIGNVSLTGNGAIGGFVGANWASVSQSYSTGSVVASPGGATLQDVGGFAGFNAGNVSTSYWDTTTSSRDVNHGVGRGDGFFGATGLTTTQFGDSANFSNWTFGTTPGGSGWVIVDTNGTLNNANGAAGATRPMLLSEWSSTITNAHQLQLIALNPAANYTLANNINLGPALANPSDVWGPNGTGGFVPIGGSGSVFSVLVGQCGTDQACTQIPTPWSSELTLAQLSALGSTPVLQANETGPFVIRLGVTTVTLSTPSGPLVLQLPEFSGGLHEGPCTACENDTVGSFSIPSNATSATIAGTFGNSVVPNSSPVNVLLSAPASAAGFSGTFNGNGYTISNLTINQPRQTNVGLFSVVASGGTVENVRLVGGNIVGLQNVGAVVGQNNGTVRNVLANVTVSGDQRVGGLVGLNNASGLVINSSAAGSVSATGNSGVGGLVGYNDGSISESFATGGVSGTDIAGGLIGFNNGNLDSSYATGSVSGHDLVGGLIGEGPGSVSQSYASGNVTGDTNVGGLIGQFSVVVPGGMLTRSYATGNVSGSANVGGLVGNNGGTINQSYATGVVIGATTVGGLVGANRAGGVIRDSYATGTVSATGTVDTPFANCLLSATCQFAIAGGLVGENLGLIEGRRLPSSEDSGCRGGFTCASGAVNVGFGGVAGGLVGWNSGVIFNAFAVGGTVHVGAQGVGGGLTGINTGAIWRSLAAVNVTGDAGLGGATGNFNNVTYLGGLVGDNQGFIAHSHATGDVGAIEVGHLEVGGLVAHNSGAISHSSATGDVRAGQSSLAGGLVGQNNSGTQDCADCKPSPAIVSRSYATGDVAVGSNSVAGGLVAVNRGTILHSGAGGAVRGAEDSILGGLAGVNDLAGLIGRSFAWGSVTGTGSNSVVAGLVGLNGGGIRDSRSSAPVSAADNSYVGGSVGINIGTVVDTQVHDGSVVVSGTGNLVGGFVGANMGLIDPSTTDVIPQAGAGNIVGSFAGANLTFDPAVFSGLTVPPPSFPAGSISSDSVNTNTASNSSPSTGTTTASNNPSTPGVINSCTDAICQIFQTGFLTPSQPPQPPQPPPSENTNSPLDTPPTPQQVLAPPSFTDNVNQPIVVNLTTEGTGANGTGANGGNGNGGNGNGNRNNTGANGAPTSPGPPPGPGIGRTLDEQRFSGVPPIGETRFLRGELVVQVSNTVPMSTVLQIAKELGITLISSQNVDVNGRVIYRFKAVSGRDIRILIRALEKKNVVASAQPNYTFRLSQSAPAPVAPGPVEHTDSIPPTAQPPSEIDLANANTAALESLPVGDSAQYVIDKMHLVQIHGLARGRGVVVAVIDSEIDTNHPDLKGVIVDRFDATQSASHPHPHGTGMAGAIAAHRRLLGVAPGVRLIAIKAFDEQAASAEATSFQILKGLDYAIAHKARIINMSFAGPHDPMMERTLKLAHEKGIILVAAAGNAGPKSPPLYPGADKNVIAVTASDYNDRPFAMANRGRYIAVAAPGVDVMVPAPGNTYQLTTGTSVATAHVSGVAALMVERKPTITPDEVRAILMRTATPYSARPKGEEDGAGLVDPIAALKALGPAQAAQAAPRPAAPTVH